MAESEEELKSLLMKAKEESEKVCLKLNIHKTKIMASGPITSWEVEGETVETVSDFIFLCSKITADGDCSLSETELKKTIQFTIALRRIKYLGINLPKEVKSRLWFFPVVMYGCEGWTVKKAEH